MQTAAPELLGGRYAFERVLGRGGAGEVSLAHDVQLDRWVAVKRLHSTSDQAQAAILEAKHLAALQHPNIVTVYDFVQDGNDVLVVMEFIHGRTLEEILVAAPLTLEDFSEVALQALDGLSAAHSIGMLHRDIKAGNIMVATTVTGRHQVKILDFGLSKIAAQPVAQTVDQAGSLLGSIHTMAPEQFEQRAVDARTDIYALGCVLYQTLTGRMPFEGDTTASVMAAHLQGSFSPLAPMRPDVPNAICLWVERLMARYMQARPSSAAEAAGLLRAIQATTRSVPTAPPPMTPHFTRARSRPAWPVLVVAGSLISCAALAFLFWPAPRSSEFPSPPSASPAAESTLPIFAPEARTEQLSNLGKPAAIEGVVSRVGRSKSGEVLYLNFAGTGRGDLSLVFFKRPGEAEFTNENLEKFVGKRVRAEGTISEYKGAPQMQIAELSQISVME